MFKFEKGKVLLDMDVVATTPYFEKLYSEDTTASKDIAISKFSLIFHMVDPRSQYSTSPSQSRFRKIIKDLFPALVAWGEENNDPVFLSAMKYYRDMLELVPERALLTAAQDAVHDLASRISNPETKDKEMLLSKMRKAVEDLEAVREIVKTAEEKAKETKGKHHVRRREDPDYLQ